jgi:hypothetical protein
MAQEVIKDALHILLITTFLMLILSTTAQLAGAATELPVEMKTPACTVEHRAGDRVIYTWTSKSVQSAMQAMSKSLRHDLEFAAAANNISPAEMDNAVIRCPEPEINEFGREYTEVTFSIR